MERQIRHFEPTPDSSMGCSTGNLKLGKTLSPESLSVLAVLLPFVGVPRFGSRRPGKLTLLLACVTVSHGHIRHAL